MFTAHLLVQNVQIINIRQTNERTSTRQMTYYQPMTVQSLEVENVEMMMNVAVGGAGGGSKNCEQLMMMISSKPVIEIQFRVPPVPAL